MLKACNIRGKLGCILCLIWINFTTSVQRGTGRCSQNNKARRRNKKHQIGKKKQIYLLLICLLSIKTQQKSCQNYWIQQSNGTLLCILQKSTHKNQLNFYTYSVVFLYTYNLKTMKTILFTIALKKKPGMNLTNKVKDLGHENYKILMNKIKDNINKWKHILYSQVKI